MKVNWPTEKLGDVLKKNGIIPVKIKRGEYRDNGKYPVIDQGEDYIAGFINDEQKLYQGDLPVVIFGDHTRILKYVDFPFAYGADGIKILKPKEGLLPKFFYYTLLFKPVQNLGYKRHFYLLKNQKIPVPPLEIQKQIVERLDKIVEAQKLNDELIQKTDELFQSLLHQELDPAGKGRELKKLGTVFTRVTEAILPTKQPDQIFNFIGLENIESNTGQLVSLKPIEGRFIKSTKTHFKSGDILYGKLRPYLNKVWLADFAGVCSTDIWVLRPKLDVIAPQLLWAILQQPCIVQKSSASMAGANLPRANKDVFDSIKIDLPSMASQKQIVDRLSAVQDYKKQLVEQKTKLKELFDSALHKSMSGEMDLDILTKN
jgi:type I restriction enzyme S subunit